MEFGMSRRIKPKRNNVLISMKEIWRNLDGQPKNKELWSYVVSFEFSRPKNSQSHCFCLFTSQTDDISRRHFQTTLDWHVPLQCTPCHDADFDFGFM